MASNPIASTRLTSRFSYRGWGSWGVMCLLLTTVFSGCLGSQQAALRRATAIAKIGSEELVEVERIRSTDPEPFWKRPWIQPATPSDRTALLLRRYNLTSEYQRDPDAVIHWLHQLIQDQPSMDEVHALAELAKIQAEWSHRTGDHARATRLYGKAVLHAYQFLFDSGLNLDRNAYDPQFRSICDVYNRALEGLLIELCDHEDFSQGYQTVLESDDQQIRLKVQIEGRWKDQKFERFELVNDYRTAGFENHYHTYGLGAPLIAIRKQQAIHSPFEKYYPPNLTMPMTAFLHFEPENDDANAGATHSDESRWRTAVLSLYDPLERTLVQTGGKIVPLESDTTTPLAYSLKDPLINKGVLATASLLNADFAPEFYGMFMLEPYDPKKIPVVMVHGLWSGPTTWAHMFNDLRANHDIHENYQFWFYSYPTAQPFWISAKQMRDDLRQIRQELDPEGTNEWLNQMVLVGHSMGGLVSTMQITDSEDHFWNVVSDQRASELEGDPAAIASLRDTFYFEPNPNISRVITIATPFRGSNFANSATRWLGQKLITLPSLVTNDFQKIARDNSGRIKNAEVLTTDTSVDSLSPVNPIFEAFHEARRLESVRTHNIVGKIEERGFLPSLAQDELGSDGVVGVQSASLPTAESEIVLAEEHSAVHEHPGTILEVNRILLQHLAEKDRVRARQVPTFQIRSADQESDSVVTAAFSDTGDSGDTAGANSSTHREANDAHPKIDVPLRR